MAVDYDRLRAENVRQYGEATHHLELLAGLYAEPTHFLYELIQNAEDAGASTMEFRLHRDSLELVHDGRPFTKSDVEGICGIGQGTKAEDLTKIGRFGIGFKSVYAYTATPEIHSGDEHFRVESYVRPFAVSDRPKLGPALTMFRFPFDSTKVPPGQAFTEISKGLDQIEVTALLFLHNVERLSWVVDDTPVATLYRSCENESEALGTILTVGQTVSPLASDAVRAALDDFEETWIVFGDDVTHDHLGAGSRVPRVELAFKAKRGPDGNLEVKALQASPLVVFFATDKETNLGVLVQGPYQTTPARDNVPPGSTWNQALVERTADLLPRALLGLRERGLLTAAALLAMPHNDLVFPVGSMFRPLYDAFRRALLTERLLPVAGGGYATAGHALLARGGDLRELLAGPRLGKALGRPRTTRWVDESVSEERTRMLYRFLRTACAIEEYNLERLAGELDDGFLEGATDGWIRRMYSSFATQRGLMGRGAKGDGPFATRRFIRLDDGAHVTPFDDDRRPNAYLPPPDATGFPVVRRSIARDAGALAFLEGLGLVLPDPIADILANVLPRYRAGDELTTEELLSDAARIFEALGDAAPRRRNDLVAALRDVPFLRGTIDGETVLARPRSLYWRTDRIEAYLADNPSLGLIDEIYAPWRSEITALGVAASVRTTKNPADRRGHVVISSRVRDHKRGLNGFDPDFSIEGLAHALRGKRIGASLEAWMVLDRHTADLDGEIEASTNQNYTNAERTTEVSAAVRVATGAGPWLPTKDGTFVQPTECALEDLPEEFRRNERLASILGLRSTGVSELAEKLGLSADLVRELADDTDFQEQVLELAAQRRKQLERTAELAPPADLDYEAGVAAALGKAAIGRNDESSADGDDSEVANPERRRHAVSEQVGRARAAAAPAPSFEAVSRRVKQERDGAAKQFLIEQYGGRCQICSFGFTRRDGHPYIEAIYLVPASKAAWVDRPGNVLGLCANCAAQFQHGTVTAPAFVERALQLRLAHEGGDGDLAIEIELCGERRCVNYTERHLLDLQELLRTTRRGPGADDVPDGQPLG